MINTLIVFAILLLLTIEPKYLGKLKIVSLQNILSQSNTQSIQHGLMVAFLLWLVYYLFQSEIEAMFKKITKEPMETDEYNYVFSVENVSISWYSYNRIALKRNDIPVNDIATTSGMLGSSFEYIEDAPNTLRNELIANWKLKIDVEGEEYFIKPIDDDQLMDDNTWIYIRSNPDISASVGSLNQGTYNVKFYKKGTIITSPQPDQSLKEDIIDVTFNMTNEYTNQNEITRPTKSAEENTINYKIQPLQNGTYTFKTSAVDNNTDTYIRLYEKNASEGTLRTFNGATYSEIASNDDITDNITYDIANDIGINNTFSHIVSQELSGNKEYILSVGGYNDAVGKFNLTINRVINRLFSPASAPAPSPSSNIFNIIPEDSLLQTPAVSGPDYETSHSSMINHPELTKGLSVEQVTPKPVYYEPGTVKYGGMGYVPSYSEMIYLNEYPFTSKPEDLREGNPYGFCNTKNNIMNTIEEKCNGLPTNVCSSTDCCVLVGGIKCVEGDKSGPKNKVIYSDTTIKNRDVYYYKGECYGNCK